MKNLLITIMITLLMVVGCDSNKKLKESFLDYQISESLGMITKYEIQDFKILDTVTNKQIVFGVWTQMNDISNQLTDSLLDVFLIQENEFRNVGEDYYEFAKKHKGASSFIDEYLDVMEKSLNIKKQGVNKSSVSNKAEITAWFKNRKNHYWGRTEEITLPASIDSMKIIENIMNNEEKLEYFRVRIKYSFMNPIFNKIVELDDVFHFDMEGNCFSTE